MNGEMISRHLEGPMAAGLDVFRSLLLHGPRQSGKTTLGLRLSDRCGGTFLSLDDPEVLEEVMNDPRYFLEEAAKPVVVDEVQLGGDKLVRTLKTIIDKSDAPGQFILTGSTNFLTVANIRESLAGRTVIYDMWPLSQAEISEAVAPMLTRLFKHPPELPDTAERLGRQQYLEMACVGGYPEMRRMTQQGERALWVESHVRTVIERDIKAVTAIRSIGNLMALFRWAAAMTGQTLNISGAQRELQISRDSLYLYLDWLETIGLTYRLTYWRRGNHVARAAKSPRLIMADTGITAALLNISQEALRHPGAEMAGPLLETFVINEVVRQAAATVTPKIRAHYFREANGRREVDCVLEMPDGAVAALEIKATSSPDRSQAKHLAWLRDQLDAVSPGKFRGGYLLHTGDRIAEIGDRIYMMPISALWAQSPP